MSQTVSEFLVERLSAWNIKRIYGYPGDGINGILGALNDAKDKIEFIQTQHEENTSLSGFTKIHLLAQDINEYLLKDIIHANEHHHTELLIHQKKLKAFRLVNFKSYAKKNCTGCTRFKT